MVNIALWFSFARELSSQRDELRLRVSELEADKRLLTDALARASGKQPIFNRPETPASDVPGMAFGPTAVRARREQQAQDEQQVIFDRAEKARNGNSPEIPVIPTN